jgi:hypothetical protein
MTHDRRSESVIPFCQVLYRTRVFAKSEGEHDGPLAFDKVVRRKPVVAAAGAGPYGNSMQGNKQLICCHFVQTMPRLRRNLVRGAERWLWFIRDRQDIQKFHFRCGPLSSVLSQYRPDRRREHRDL